MPDNDTDDTTDTTDTTDVSLRAEQDALDAVDVGQRIDDFDLLTDLGRGSFAKVFLARQESMQRLVAVKVSRNHGTEPETLAQLDHDYVVRVFDQRLIAGGELKLMYMQYIAGGTMFGVLRKVHRTPVAERDGRLLLDAIDELMTAKGDVRPSESVSRAQIAALTWPETVAWLGRRLAEALGYADKHGVLHRDIKPANVLLTPEGVPKLADFNISFSTHLAGSSPVAYFGGSLRYMSPEQLDACRRDHMGRAARLDTRSDLFALAVMLWELLTGAHPFTDEPDAGNSETSLDRMLELRRRGISPEALATLPPDCPPTLSRVLLKCLAPERDERWSTGAELTRQLDLVLDPYTRDLVDPPPTSWRARLAPFPIPVVALSGLVPNALAALYNVHHNRTLIVDQLRPDAADRLHGISTAVQITLFSLGIAVILYQARYILTVPRGIRNGRKYSPDILAHARTDTLLLGDRMALVAIAMWGLAGASLGVGLELTDTHVGTGAFIHFVSSVLVCGAIAVAYPFFLVTFYMVRCIYPVFVSQGDAADARRLRALARRGSFYLAVAASVPLIGVAGVTFLDTGELPKIIVPVRILCIGGIFGFLLAYGLYRRLERDLSALEVATTR